MYYKIGHHVSVLISILVDFNKFN